MAAVLLCATAFLRRLALDAAIPVEAILTSTGISRSRAYELRDALLEMAPAIVRPRGRPAAPAEAIPASTQLALARAALEFVYAHPGCVHGGPERRRYGDEFRRFVIDLRAKHSEIGLVAFASAIFIPAETCEPWLRVPASGLSTTSSDTILSDAAHPQDESERRSIELVLATWRKWRGNFGDFCEHVREQWRVPFGRTIIAAILQTHGLRKPQRRPRRSPDEIALRESFETFFPGAQWTGDGSQVPVVVDGQRIVVNLELDIDTHTAAVVGLAVTYEEDPQAVVDTFASGVETTGANPLALLLDNKPSNHTEAVDDALKHNTDRSLDDQDTLRIRATLRRPQNKAHVEGAFGLFKTDAPPLEVTTHSPRELARQVAEIAATTWARTLNHRPRLDRGGQSRFDLYGEPVSEQQIADARAALDERCRKQELARATALARADPLVRAMLEDAFTRLELADPEHHIKSAIARYPADIIISAIAIFTSKRDAQTLPPTADARYLQGIVTNIADKRELLTLSSAIVDERIRWRDCALSALAAELESIARENAEPQKLASAIAVRLVSAFRTIDELFFLDALIKNILALPVDARTAAYQHLARIVSASFAATKECRQRILLALAAGVWPLD